MTKHKLLPCIAVNQPIGAFYLTMMRAGELLASVDILRRGLDPDTQANVQRELSGPRTKEIAAFVSDPDATFPTSIIIAAYDDCVHVVPGGRELLFATPVDLGSDVSKPTDGHTFDLERFRPLEAGTKIGEVIDGQHRLEGLAQAGARSQDSPHYSFEIPIVVMLNTDPADRAYVFATINSKQTRVPSSLIYDLFGLAKGRSTRKTCHEVASALNATPSSPFYRTLKMLGKRTAPTESLTQGSFAKYLLDMISRTPDEDDRLLKRGEQIHDDSKCIFRPFFRSGRDELIVKALSNYFTAVSEAYPSAWIDTDNYALKRTVGLQALMRSLSFVWTREVLPQGSATVEVFRGVCARFAHSVPEESFRGVPSSGGSATNLYKQLTASWPQ